MLKPGRTLLKYNTLRDAPTEPLRTVFSGNTSKMTASSSKVSTASVTIHAVSLTPQTTIPVLDAAEEKGYGFRQYPTVESFWTQRLRRLWAAY